MPIGRCQDHIPAFAVSPHIMRFDFARCDTLPRLAWCAHTWRSACERGAKALKRVWWTGGKTAESLLPLLSRFQNWDHMDFAMHWGQPRVRPRYAEALTALATDAARSTNASDSRG